MSFLTLKYNCVQYGDGGQGAIFDYPEFVNPTEGVGLDYNGSLSHLTLLLVPLYKCGNT